MKRLLAAVGLAAVACLALTLAACTDGLSTTEDNPLLDRSDSVSGTVERNGFPERGATVEIFYWDGDESGGHWDHASHMLGLTNIDGEWTLPYIEDARGHDGIAYGFKYIGQVKWEGWSAQYYYPVSGGAVTGVEIVLTCD